jgi:hypothetical protein
MFGVWALIVVAAMNTVSHQTMERIRRRRMGVLLSEAGTALGAYAAVAKGEDRITTGILGSDSVA